MTEKSNLEKILGHPLTSTALTGAAALAAAGPLSNVVTASLLGVVPAFVDTIASNRAQARTEQTIAALSKDMEELQINIDKLSDNQVAFIESTVASIFTTSDEKKLQILKEAASRVAQHDDLVEDRGAILSRTLREMSTAEIAFLIRYFGAPVFVRNDSSEPQRETTLSPMFTPSSEETTEISGLISLGVLLPVPGPWIATQFDWSRTAGKILAIVGGQPQLAK